MKKENTMTRATKLLAALVATTCLVTPALAANVRTLLIRLTISSCGVALPATAPPYSGGMCSQKTVSYPRPAEPVQYSPVSRHVKPYSANWRERRQKARVMAALYKRRKPEPVWDGVF